MEEKFDEMLEYFGDEVFEDNDHFENYRKTIITIVSYLLGVPDDKFTKQISLFNVTDIFIIDN